MIEKHFRDFCGSNLWESNSLNSTTPDFTFCFQNTLLIWFPCFIIWIVSPFWIYMLTKPPDYKIKISWILNAKTILTSTLIIIELLNIMDRLNNEYRYAVYYMTPLILMLTYGMALFISHFERIRGLRSSSLIFSFWLALAIVSIIRFRTAILHIHERKNLINNVLFFIHYISVILNLIVSIFTEKPINKEVDLRIGSADFINKTSLKIMPENSVNLLSRLCFWWINALIKTGYKRDLQREDLWSIDVTESSAHITKKLETAWNAAAKEYIRMHKDLEESLNSTPTKANRIYKYDKNATSNDKDEKEKLKNDEGELSVKIVKPSKLKKPSFTLCLVKVYGGKFLAGSFIKLIQDLLIFAGPIILDRLIKFIKQKDQHMMVGIFYTCLLFLCSLLQSFVLQHYFHRMFIVGARIRTAIMNIVYKKSLRLSPSARKSATVGEMTNLIAVNAQSLGDLTTYLNIIWSAPLQITISMIMLYNYLGIASIIGLLSIILFIPLNILVGNMTKKIQLKKMKFQDSRIKMMNEILSGIKVIKFYGWEISFQNIVGKIRNTELNYMKRMNLLSISSSFLWNCAPLVMTICSFGSFILLNDGEKFTADVVFVSLSLFNILRFPLTVLPSIITAIISAQVSITRISTFLLKDEINDDDIKFENIEGIAVQAKNVALGWDKKEAMINNLNLEIKKEKLIAIVGSVGCGKSSLLAGLLGEMHKLNDGLININGSTAYVPQQAWIQNATVRNNILFGSLYNEEIYDKIVECCCLKTDFNIMPAGDKTEIGEKGINLSGGQKQRISLARAIYSNADIYMLDDPLSAVDAHVGKDIFDKVIGPNGLLKNKTRLFVTNSISFLPQCDHVIMLENGLIVESGNYKELKSKGGIFANFIQKYFSNKENINNENEELKNEDQIDKVQDKIESKKIEKQSSLTKDFKEKSNNINKTEKEEVKKGEKIIQKEKIESGKVKLSVLVEFFKACGYFMVVIFMLVFIVSNFFSISGNYWLSYWSKDPKNNDSKYQNFFIYSIIGLFQCITSLVSDFIFLFMCLHAAKLMHNNMLYSILRSTMEFFESTPSGRIINRFSKDIESVEKSIPESFRTLLKCFFHVFFTMLVISFSTPWFMITLVPLLILYVFVQRYFVSSMRQLKRLESASKSPIFSHFSESITGTSTIRAYKCQSRFIGIMEGHVDENLLFYFPNNISNRWLALRLELIGNLVSVFAAFFAVLARDSITAGIAGLSISYSLNVSQTLNWLVRMSAEFETNITSIERVKEYCETPHENEWNDEKNKPDKEWPQKGQIEMKNYSVKYRKDLENVLNDITITILPGEKIGIVGRTGAGKSSLSLGLFRLLEYSTGDIIIDNVNIKNIGLHDLRHKLTIIPQDPVIFSGTLRVNLDPLGLHNDEKLWDSLEHSHLKQFVLGLEKKLEFECSEGGENLSVGQRQLICLARALLRKTKILTLDEATASVDHNTDELIQNTIRTEFKDCTVLTVAHRLNTIMDSTRIMVLDKGRIIEFDTPKNLLRNKNSSFYSMALDAGLVKA